MGEGAIVYLYINVSWLKVVMCFYLSIWVGWRCYSVHVLIWVKGRCYCVCMYYCKLGEGANVYLGINLCWGHSILYLCFNISWGKVLLCICVIIWVDGRCYFVFLYWYGFVEGALVFLCINVSWGKVLLCIYLLM